jgi:hypothetical protein
MRGKQVRKSPKKSPPFDSEQLIDLSLRLGLNTFMTEWSLQDWADQVNRAWMKKKAHVKTGWILTLAKRVVPHGDWGRLFEKHRQAVARPLLMSDRTAERLVRLARHPTLPKKLLTNSTHWSNLPSSWRTLAELARLAPNVVEVLLAQGRIHPKLQRAEVSTWIAWLRAQQLKQATERRSQEHRPPQ